MKNFNPWIIQAIWSSIAAAAVADHNAADSLIVHMDNARIDDLFTSIGSKCASDSASPCHLQSIMMILFIGK